MTKTEAALQAFKALLEASPGLPPVARNTNTFKRVEAFTVTIEGDPVTADVGFVLFDGNGDIVAELSGPGSYEMEHTAELDILVMGAASDAVFDAILAAMAALVGANPAAEHWNNLELGVPQRDFAPDETHDAGKSCVLPVKFTFRSPHPF